MLALRVIVITYIFTGVLSGHPAIKEENRLMAMKKLLPSKYLKDNKKVFPGGECEFSMIWNKEIKYMDLESLEDIQSECLKKTTGHAYRNNPFCGVKTASLTACPLKMGRL